MMPMTADNLRVLVADDQQDVLQAIRLLLKGAGHSAETVDSPAALLRAAEARPYDVILMDMNYARDTTSGQEGLDVLKALRSQRNHTPVIVMTAWGSVDVAVEAMRRGAVDFVQKPWDNSRLLDSIAEQAGRARAASQAREEVEIARNVQRKLLPQHSKPMATVEYAGLCIPAREVGGDYYDFLDFGPGKLGIVLADVSGKGVAAALLMANLQALFRTHTDLATINRLFRESTPLEQYATLFFAIYEDDTRTLRYSNCGHPPPVVRRANGDFETLDPTATVIGLFADWSCTEASVRLQPGDVALIYSDGVCEAGEDTARTFISDLPASALAESIATQCTDEQTDDVTVVVLRAV